MKLRKGGSLYTYLSEGCRMCAKGSKLVIFISDECPNSCHYCPISPEKEGTYANETRINMPEDLLNEAERMNAEGASITGGEPLIHLKKTAGIITLLKRFYGDEFHIHLYTSIPAREKEIELLYSSGLDEIRFHPPDLKNPEGYLLSLEISAEHGMEYGFEIPALRFDMGIVNAVNDTSAFLNINQVEYTPYNFKRLIKEYSFEEGAGAIESEEIALNYAKMVRKFHYCTSRFKDGVQLRNRFKRMSKRMDPLYTKTEDGTIICGFVEGDTEKLKKLMRRYGVRCILKERGVEIDPEIALRLSGRLKRKGFNVSIIERYPTSDQTVVEVIPL